MKFLTTLHLVRCFIYVELLGGYAGFYNCIPRMPRGVPHLEYSRFLRGTHLPSRLSSTSCLNGVMAINWRKLAEIGTSGSRLRDSPRLTEKKT